MSADNLLGESPDRIIREEECRRITGLCRTTRWRKMKTGEFPQPVRLGVYARGWRLSEVMAWVGALRPEPGGQGRVLRYCSASDPQSKSMNSVDAGVTRSAKS